MGEEQQETRPPLCGLTEEQVDALQAPLDARHIEMRQGFAYLKGHHVIREMNRIFGPAGWSRETVSMKRVVEAPYEKDGKVGTEVAFVAQVRVVAGGVIKEGTGFGNGITYQQTVADAYESATKEAETDAFKRACMMFGDPVGLALYDTSQTHVVGGGGEQARGGQLQGAPEADPGHFTPPQQQPASDGTNPLCPKCGRGMVKRNGNRGPFWGCQSYPDCTGTRQIATPAPQNAEASEEPPPQEQPPDGAYDDEDPFA